MSREEALTLVRQHISNENLIAHVIATEALMRAIATEKGQDVEEWGLAGLVHDLDAEETTPAEHGMRGADLLREMGWPEVTVEAVRAHNGANNGTPAVTLMAKALRPADQMTGLITAAALIRPDRLGGLTAESVVKRFKEKRFAAGVNREEILECREIGYELLPFARLGVEAMQSVRGYLGL